MQEGGNVNKTEVLQCLQAFRTERDKVRAPVVERKPAEVAPANFKVNVVTPQPAVAPTEPGPEAKAKKRVRFTEGSDDEEMQEAVSSSKSEEVEATEYFDFEEMKRDIEDYRTSGMSSFQKVNHFFIVFVSDPLYYYVTGKRDFALEHAFEQTSTRDFLLRQLQIQIEDFVLPSC